MQQRRKMFFFVVVVVVVVVAVPSTVPTSEALLPRRSSRHPSPPATPRAHSASRPRPQRSTGSDVRSLVGLPSEGNTALLLSHFGGVQ